MLSSWRPSRVFADDNEKWGASQGRAPVGVGFNRQADAGPAADEISLAGKSGKLTLLRFPLSVISLSNKNML
jgi:hypothetical protein